MNGNSSKQVLLSVLGIAVLVVAVVGVSFAFFSYSKNGEKNNTLTTGSIFFNLIEGDAITLSDQFPISDAEGKSLSTAENGALTFSVTGYDGSSKGIAYTITAIPGGVETGRTRFADSAIKLYLEGEKALTNNYSDPKAVGVNGSLDNGVVLATGKIEATSSDAQQTDNYTLRMWISSDLVQIDESESAGDDDNVFTSTEFGNMYYSLKVKVDANTATN